MNSPALEIIDSTGSTNTSLLEKLAARPALPHGYALAARAQLAGRGQRGNSWESQPAMNVALSVLLRPEGLPAARQFVMLEAVSLAVRRLVAALVAPKVADERVTVKWPNDIYVDNRKISGTLIENRLDGAMVATMVAGIGVNINQTEFVSDAPNPVSVKQLTGVTHSVDRCLERLHALVMEEAARTATPEGCAAVHADYRRHLWRATGLHPWRVTADGSRITASVADVATTGHLTLRQPDGTAATFAFKEVHPILTPEPQLP